MKFKLYTERKIKNLTKGFFLEQEEVELPMSNKTNQTKEKKERLIFDFEQFIMYA